MRSEDVLMVVGVVLAVLAIPAIVSAVVDNRSPRTAAVVVMISGVLLLLSILYRPEPFTPSEVPDAFVRVIAAILR